MFISADISALNAQWANRTSFDGIIDFYTNQCLTLLTAIRCLFGVIHWATEMPINVFRRSRCLNMSDSICDFLRERVTRMTEMTKKMESRKWEQMTEVYRLAVICLVWVTCQTCLTASINKLYHIILCHYVSYLLVWNWCQLFIKGIPPTVTFEGLH